MPKPPLPPEKYKSKKAEIRMTESEYQALNSLAISQGLTISKFIRKLLREWAKREQNKMHPDLF
jgi:predicted HicB family RNase H-like nuclease